MLIIGCDSHSRSQQIAMIAPETGEFEEHRLEHSNGEARRFYASLAEGTLVGVESTGYTLWFAELLSELGHELAVGDAARIRAWHLSTILSSSYFAKCITPHLSG